LVTIQGIEAAALLEVSTWAMRYGKWKVAFVPLVCAGMVGVVLAAGY
jgi:hypothetical protein